MHLFLHQKPLFPLDVFQQGVPVAEVPALALVDLRLDALAPALLLIDGLDEVLYFLHVLPDILSAFPRLLLLELAAAEAAHADQSEDSLVDAEGTAVEAHNGLLLHDIYDI